MQTAIALTTVILALMDKAFMGGFPVRIEGRISPAGYDPAAQNESVANGRIAAGRHHVLNVGLDVEMAVDVEAVGRFDSRLGLSQQANLARRIPKSGMREGKSRLVRRAAE